jgi:hypothetical protein
MQQEKGMINLMIQIDAGGGLCSHCKMRDETAHKTPYCKLFDLQLTRDVRGNALRVGDCITAEAALKPPATVSVAHEDCPSYSKLTDAQRERAEAIR